MQRRRRQNKPQQPMAISNGSGNRSLVHYFVEQDSQLEICLVILLFGGLFMGLGRKKYILNFKKKKTGNYKIKKEINPNTRRSLDPMVGVGCLLLDIMRPISQSYFHVSYLCSLK